MPIRAQCGECGRRIQARGEMAGRRIKCPDCGGPIPLRGKPQNDGSRVELNPTSKGPLVAGVVGYLTICSAVLLIAFLTTDDEEPDVEHLADEADNLAETLQTVLETPQERQDRKTKLEWERFCRERKPTRREAEIARYFTERGFYNPLGPNGDRPRALSPGGGEHDLADIDFSLLAEWRECVTISFKDLPVGDEVFDQISRVKGLQHLHLTGTNVTDEGLRKLTVHSQLVAIHLERSQITDEGLRILGTLPALASLELDETQVTGAGLNGFPKSASLTWVSFRRTQFRDEFVPLLALPNLRRVSISECPTVTDACVPELKKLTHLNFINLYATQVSAEHRAKYTGKPL